MWFSWYSCWFWRRYYLESHSEFIRLKNKALQILLYAAFTCIYQIFVTYLSLILIRKHCIINFVQVKREKWPITTNYCPCDLFSGYTFHGDWLWTFVEIQGLFFIHVFAFRCPVRMRKALISLLEVPQNNLTLFLVSVFKYTYC